MKHNRDETLLQANYHIYSHAEKYLLGKLITLHHGLYIRHYVIFITTLRHIWRHATPSHCVNVWLADKPAYF